MLQAGRPQARCVHVQDIGREGQAYIIITGSTKNARKHGTKGRQGKIGNQDTPVRESQSSDLTVFFLPLM